MKKLFIAGAVAFFAISCSKDQKAVRKLDGTWTLKSSTTNGTAENLDGTTITVKFEKCKVKKEDCSGSRTVKITGVPDATTSFKYTITDKGELIKITNAGSSSSQSSKITELTKDKLVIESTENGVTSVDTYEQ